MHAGTLSRAPMVGSRPRRHRNRRKVLGHGSPRTASGRDCADILGATHLLTPAPDRRAARRSSRRPSARASQPASAHSRRRGGRVERLADLLLGVIQINDLNRLGELFGSHVPDPGGPVAHNHLTLGQPKAPALGLTAYPPGERRQVGIGVSGGGTFDRRRVADRARVAPRPALRVEGFRRPERDQLDLARPDPSGCLPARPSVSPGRTGTPVPSMPRTIVGAEGGSDSTRRHSS